jgi:hypothetical protein
LGLTLEVPERIPNQRHRGGGVRNRPASLRFGRLQLRPQRVDLAARDAGRLGVVPLLLERARPLPVGVGVPDAAHGRERDKRQQRRHEDLLHSLGSLPNGLKNAIAPSRVPV